MKIVVVILIALLALISNPDTTNVQEKRVKALLFVNDTTPLRHDVISKLDSVLTKIKERKK